jgi:hypothetical protein
VTKLLRLIAVAGMLLGTVHTAAAQTAEEIVEKHIAALGGRAALSKLTSRTATGTITVSTPVGELSGPIEVLSQSPNKSRTLINLDLSSVGAGKMTIDQRFDGTAGYVMDTLQGNRDITGDQLEGMRNGYFPTALLNYKENGITLELAGKEKIGDRDVFALIVKPKTGPPMRQYFDATTFSMVRQIIKANVPPVGEIEQTVDFFDEKDVDGIKVPHKLTATSSAQNFTVTLTKIEHNGAIDQTLFSKPAN